MNAHPGFLSASVASQTLVACVLCSSVEAAEQGVVQDGLILNYDFTAGSLPDDQGNVRDLSGHGIHAAIRPTSLASERTGWQPHRIKQGDGQGGRITRPAQIQVLRKAEGRSTIPFGLVEMDNGEVALICSWHNGQAEQPVIAFSQDGGDTWSEFQTIPGAAGRPMNLAYLGQGNLTFIANQRFFSHDYGRTWPESVAPQPTADGLPFDVEGNAWVDFDANGNATQLWSAEASASARQQRLTHSKIMQLWSAEASASARQQRLTHSKIMEIGWHYEPGKKHPVDDATCVFRYSTDGGRTWQGEVSPKEWKFSLPYQGKPLLRGVSEGAIVRAANGWLVAALRTDMPPHFFDGPHDDSLEGTGISISQDDGQTWSPLNILFTAGRHHANLSRLPNGDLVCVMIVRDDIQDGKLASHRRGCDAVISHDNGRTWNLDRRFTLDEWDYYDPNYWVNGQCGHLGSVVLKDGHLLTAYGHYLKGAAVLVKWQPDAAPAPAEEAEAEASALQDTVEDYSRQSIYQQGAEKGRDYEVVVTAGGIQEVQLKGTSWIDVPLDDRILALSGDATLEFILRPEYQGGFVSLLRCGNVPTPDLGFWIAYDQRDLTNSMQVLFSDERIKGERPADYSVQVHADSIPSPFEPVVQQIAYVVQNGQGTFYRDGQPFSHQAAGGQAGREQLFRYCADQSGGKESLRLTVGAYPRPGQVDCTFTGGFLAIRFYNRALSAEELKRNRAATLGRE